MASGFQFIRLQKNFKDGQSGPSTLNKICHEEILKIIAKIAESEDEDCLIQWKIHLHELPHQILEQIISEIKICLDIRLIERSYNPTAFHNYRLGLQVVLQIKDSGHICFEGQYNSQKMLQSTDWYFWLPAKYYFEKVI